MPDVTASGDEGGNGSVAPAVVVVVAESKTNVQVGDVIEFTLRGERRTAEAMLLTDGDLVLLDLFDGDRPAWAPLSVLEDVEVFRPDTDHVLTAA